MEFGKKFALGVCVWSTIYATSGRDDLILSGNVFPEFGQVEKLVDSADLTIGSSSAITTRIIEEAIDSLWAPGVGEASSTGWSEAFRGRIALLPRGLTRQWHGVPYCAILLANRRREHERKTDPR